MQIILTQKKLIFWVTLLILLIFAVTPRGYAADLENQPAPEEAEPTTFPYTKKFTISGYYSPLPGQEQYVTGSFDGDVRLNGEGVHTADGSLVYAGLMAAPKRYPFGTKMLVPGLGTFAVHDRGGAIKGNRLDVWLGHGDEGLRRALGWGLRTVSVTVYGLDDSIHESVNFTSVPLADSVGIIARNRYFRTDLALGDNGDEVKKMQTFLKKVGFFENEATGFFGDETRQAVLRFQLEQKIIDDENDTGAGNFGPRTRVALEALLEKNKNEALGAVPRVQLSRGMQGEAVTQLQTTLKQLGFLSEISGTFDDATADALTRLQLDYEVIAASSDRGAAFYGPKTQVVMQKLITGQYTPPSSTAVVPHNEPAAAVISVKPAFTKEISIKDNGPEVAALQEELRRLHLFGVEPTGHFGKTTEHAVVKFQQTFDIIKSEKDEGAGVVGPKTMAKLNELIARRSDQTTQIAKATEQYHLVASRVQDEKVLLVDSVSDLANTGGFSRDITYGTRGTEIEQLQKTLKRLGFFRGRLVTQYFGDITQSAVSAFQQNHGIPASGLLDTPTRLMLNQLIGTVQS